MNIYQFTFNTFGKTLKVKKQILEVEEKPKTYIRINVGWSSRINKTDIGVVSGYLKDVVLLLEDNIERAKELFLEEIKRKISNEENKIEHSKKEIEKLNNYIYDLKCIKESEE